MIKIPYDLSAAVHLALGRINRNARNVKSVSVVMKDGENAVIEILVEKEKISMSINPLSQEGFDNEKKTTVDIESV